MLKQTLVSIGAVAALASLAGCNTSSSTVASDPAASTPSATTPSVSPTVSPGGSTSAAAGRCTYTPDGAGSAGIKVSLPPSTPTETGEVPATIDTGVGTFHATLDASKAPCTVNSFVSLAKQGYFDDTPCHRLTTSGIFVLQCGDPSGSGSGGPGYSFDDELTGKEHYGTGLLAMANAGPNTNGSQFFIIYANSSALNSEPNYTIFGKVDAATVADLVKVAKAGTNNAFGAGDGAPNKKVQITKVTIG